MTHAINHNFFVQSTYHLPLNRCSCVLQEEEKPNDVSIHPILRLLSAYYDSFFAFFPRQNDTTAARGCTSGLFVVLQSRSTNPSSR